jgi:hypothetical protein
MTAGRRLGWLVACVAASSGGSVSAQATGESILARYDFAAPPADRWTLPKALNEVSGLALDGDRLLAHGDEQAIIYRLDPAAHAVVDWFSLGRPAVAGDFEGIALQDRRLFLTTSDGDVYAAPLGGAGAAVTYQRFVSGIGRSCEVEGLAGDGTPGGLLLGCKTARRRALNGRLAVFAWSPGQREAAQLRLVVPEHQLSHTGDAAVHPSELVRDPATGHLLLLAARAHLIIELSAAGEVVATARLKRSLHRQAEGLALAGDGALYVADEAAGARATLTTYRPVR